MKFTFHFSAKQAFGDLQANISKALVEYLQAGKDFSVSFEAVKEGKTWEQLKGIHKLCALYAARLSSIQGKIISQDCAKEAIKYKLNYVELADYEECFKQGLKLRREKELLGQKMSLKDFNFLVDHLQKTYLVPRSFADATKEEMPSLIQEFEEYARDMSWHEIRLETEEMKSLLEYYNNLLKK